MKFDYDIVIAGGGLAGNSLALALKDSGLKIAILESQSRTQLQQASLGDRALALSAGTVKLLEALRVWNAVQTQATPRFMFPTGAIGVKPVYHLVTIVWMHSVM